MKYFKDLSNVKSMTFSLYEEKSDNQKSEFVKIGDDINIDFVATNN